MVTCDRNSHNISAGISGCRGASVGIEVTDRNQAVGSVQQPERPILDDLLDGRVLAVAGQGLARHGIADAFAHRPVEGRLQEDSSRNIDKGEHHGNDRQGYERALEQSAATLPRLPAYFPVRLRRGNSWIREVLDLTHRFFAFAMSLSQPNYLSGGYIQSTGIRRGLE